MIVSIRIHSTGRGNNDADEHEQLAEIATTGQLYRALNLTAQRYTRLREEHCRATARSSSGRVLASVGVSPDAVVRAETPFRGPGGKPMKHTGFIATFLTLLACGDAGAPPAPAVDVTDSAGIRIVITRPGDLVYAELAAEPSLSIGEFTGPEELLFGRIASARRDAVGNVVVADGQAHEIRIFDRDGRHLRSLGREGEGPGEFELLRGAWPVTGGSIVTTDILQDRITLFGAAETAIETATLAESDIFGRIFTIGLAGPGMVLSRTYPRTVPTVESLSGSLEDMWGTMSGGKENRRLLFVRHRFDGTLADTLAWGMNGLRASVSRGNGREMEVTTFTVPFSPRSVAAGSSLGVVSTDGVAYGLRVFGENGSLRLIARLDDSPRLRTGPHLERYVRGSFPGSDERLIQDFIERYRQSPLPDSLPAYTDLLFAEGGEVWAQRYRLPDESMRRWDVFAADGVYLGRVAVPASFRIEEVSRGEALGVATDELGVERVQLYDLVQVGRDLAAPSEPFRAVQAAKRPKC